MNNAIYQIKEEHRNLALELRIEKKLLKSKQRTDDPFWTFQTEFLVKKTEFRHKHIARCLLRGTPYNKIESKVRPGNEPNEDLIQRYKEEYSNRIKGIVSDSKNTPNEAPKKVEDRVEQKSFMSKLLGVFSC